MQVDLSKEEAKFLIDCINFARSVGILRAIEGYDQLGYQVAHRLAPAAIRGSGT